MPRPVEDKQLLYARSLKYEGKEWEAYKEAWLKFPTYVEDCQVKRAKKEQLRTDYMNLLLKDG